MTKWRDGGNLGRLDRVIIGGSDEVCTVRTRRDIYFDEGEGYTRRRGWRMQPWPEGEANFRLILTAPQMLEALEMIWSIRQSAAYEERTEAGITGYVFYLTEEQCAKVKAAIAAAKGEDDEKIVAHASHC